MAPRPPSARPPSSDVPSARTAAAERASYRQVLGHGEFRAIFAADVVSMLGNVVAAVALTVLVYQRTHSPALAASVMTLAFLPYLFGGILLGAAADRLPARGVLVGCDLISASLVGVMVIPGIPVAGMLALLFVAGLVSPVYSGARSALLPDVLTPGPRYVLGRALLRTVAQSAQIVASGLGGLLLAALSPRGALAVDAVSFAASAAVLRFGTAARRPRAGKAGSMARDSLAGLRAVLAHRQIRRILLFSWLVPACAVAPEALAAPYVTAIGLSPPAGVIAARLLPTRLQRRAVVPAGLVVIAPLAAFAALPGLAAAIGLLVVSGLGSAWGAGIDGLLVEAAPEHLRSRALAAGSAGLMFTQGVGFAFWGLAGQFVPLALVIPGAAVLGTAVVIALRPPRALTPCADSVQ